MEAYYRVKFGLPRFPRLKLSFNCFLQRHFMVLRYLLLVANKFGTFAKAGDGEMWRSLLLEKQKNPSISHLFWLKKKECSTAIKQIICKINLWNSVFGLTKNEAMTHDTSKFTQLSSPYWVYRSYKIGDLDSVLRHVWSVELCRFGVFGLRRKNKSSARPLSPSLLEKIFKIRD